MYDELLKQDLINFKSLDNIDVIENSNILKIIKNRTKDKLYLIKVLLEENVITPESYEEFYNRIKNDFRMSQLYILGLCQI